MSKVYQSVRGVVQGTLHRPKPQSMVSAATKGNGGSLNDAIEQLEKIFVDGVGRLKAAVSDDQAVVAIAAQHAEQLIEGLKANITVLEARVRQTEDAIHKQDVASQQAEESFGTEIRDLQSALKKKEKDLETRESEVNDLNSKTDVLQEQVTQLELVIEQAQGDAASETQHAEQATEDLKIKIARLQAQLNQTEKIVGGTDSTIKGFDHNRDSLAIDLDAQLEPQKNGINDSDAEASVHIQAQGNGDLAGEQLKTAEEKPTALRFPATAATPIATEAAPETVSQDAFNRMIAEFGELTNVMGSIASLIVRDHVRALGESMEEFPQMRLTKLLDSLSKEISDDKLKADFCDRFAKM